MSQEEQRQHPTRIALRGYERMATMVPSFSRKIAHSMLVRGSGDAAVDDLLRLLPVAVMRTFNKHPRMRALQLRDEFATAEIQPHISLEDVHSRRLLRVRDNAGNSEREWPQYVERECEVAFDRFQEFPFFLSTWREGPSVMRLLLFSDHYMSDGMSGLTVLNSVLESIAALSKDETVAVQDELPLRPSVYQLWLEPLRFTRIMGEYLVWMVGRKFFQRDVASFKPLLPPSADQQHMTLPVTIHNPTRALFADGSTENAPKILARCKQERVSYGAAVMAAAALAFYVTAKTHSIDVDPEHFRLAMNVDINMRKRVSSPPEEDPVGHYVSGGSVSKLAEQTGVDLTRSRFWDVARMIRDDIQAAANNDFKLALSPIFQDQVLRSDARQGDLGFEVPFAITSDAGISSIGRYPYATTFSLGAESSLSIDSLHFYNSMPVLAPAVGLYVSSIDKFCYGIASKVDDDVATTLFRAFVALAEHISAIGADETMLQVAETIVQESKAE